LKILVILFSKLLILLKIVRNRISKTKKMISLNNQLNKKIHMKRIFYFLFIINVFQLHSSKIFAQNEADGCATHNPIFQFNKEEWIGNNSVLDSISAEYNLNSTTFDYKTAIYRVPIQFWVYRKKDKTGGANLGELKKLIQDANFYNIQNQTGFLYYMIPDVIYVDKNNRQEIYFGSETYFVTRKSSRNNCINVHVIPRLIRLKLLPWKTTKKVFGSYNTKTHGIFVMRSGSNTTLSHEIGHFFSLKHPHEGYNKGKGRQEAVSRTRQFTGRLFKQGLICETNGDGLCDTPAEPNLQNYVGPNCTFTATSLKDNWGDFYQPNTNNIMSYPSDRSCRTQFTEHQKAAMLLRAKQYNITNWTTGFQNGAQTNFQFNFDIHEPNENMEMAGEIIINEAQQHTFHKIFDETTIKDIDQDWVKFRVIHERSGEITIATAAGEYKQAGTKLSLYDANGTLLKTSQNVTGFGEIKVSALTRGWYYVKIEQIGNVASPNVASYSLSVKL